MANSTYEVEKTLLFRAIDRFFGAKVQKEDGSYNEVIDSPIGVTNELKRLGILLSGGAIVSFFTNNPVNDLDFYIKDPKNIPEAMVFLRKWFPEPPFTSINATTYKRKSGRNVFVAQLITKFTGDPDKIHDFFDFTVTQASYDFELAEFVFGSRFFADLAKRRLVFLGKSHYPICALYRTKKYQERGFYLPGVTLMHIGLSITRLKISNYGQLKEQLMGIDTAYLQGFLEKYEDSIPLDYAEFLERVFDKGDSVNICEALPFETEEEANIHASNQPGN